MLIKTDTLMIYEKDFKSFGDYPLYFVFLVILTTSRNNVSLLT